MNNWDIYNIVNYLVNKHQAGNTFTTVEFQDMLNHSSLKLLKRRLGLPEEYQAQPISQMGYADTSRMIVDLAPFVVNDYGATSLGGVVTKPSNFAYPIAMNIKCKIECTPNHKIVPVELLNAGEYFMRTSSILRPIDLDNPVYVIEKDLHVFPNTITFVDMSYIKYPDAAVIATTTNNYGEVVYNSSGSTELEWDNMAKADIISILLSSVGLNLRSADIIQVAENLKNTGK